MVRPLFLAALLTSACSPRERGPASLPPGDYKPRKEDDELPLPRDRAAELRNNAFARARVWHEPATPVPAVDFRANPPGPDSFPTDAEVVCKFLLKASGGQTPKPLSVCFVTALPNANRLPSGERRALWAW